MSCFKGALRSALLKVQQHTKGVYMKTEKDYVSLAIEREEAAIKFFKTKLGELKDQIKEAASRQRATKEAIATLSRATATRQGGSLSTGALAYSISSGKNLINNSEMAREDIRGKLKQSRAILAALKTSQEK